MTVKHCLKEKGLQSEVVDFKRYQIVAIAFYNTVDEREDEVTFDIQHAGTKAGQLPRPTANALEVGKWMYFYNFLPK